jgi:hypothetical protein
MMPVKGCKGAQGLTDLCCCLMLWSVCNLQQPQHARPVDYECSQSLFWVGQKSLNCCDRQSIELSVVWQLTQSHQVFAVLF